MRWLLVFMLLFTMSCNLSDRSKTPSPEKAQTSIEASPPGAVSLIVLGTLQDAGSPHIGCRKDCCAALFTQPDRLRQVVSLGVIDLIAKQTYLFEATPNISRQTKKLKEISGMQQELPNGIFLTHAHIGHYSGLMYLGKEATNASEVPVYAMPRMKAFLETNGPWSQLVAENNIAIQAMNHQETISLSSQLSVTPFLVPHRDEYSETVGYKIQGPHKSVLFIPDINKWEAWETNIVEAISAVDYAFVDATFFSGKELNTRDISEIPHPFIIESLQLFDSLDPSEKQKIHFIHFNHTNPVIDTQSEAYQTVIDKGFRVARIHQLISL